ncbi:MAG: thioredoxin domain-containing protein [Methylotenera sp.]|nr:thioredoxin domain-containing protein [Methylotenera sp.]MDP1766489.1 thioredoxin domain-containing protein [Methylotenera sp.]
MTVITLTKANFKKVIESNHFVIIDFWAEWCEPCLSFSPTFQQAAKQNPDIVFGMLNSDTDADIAAFFNIEQIPCVLALKDQVVIDGVVGVMPSDKFNQSIQQWRDFDNTEINRHFAEKILAENN